MSSVLNLKRSNESQRNIIVDLMDELMKIQNLFSKLWILLKRKKRKERKNKQFDF